MFGFPPGCDVPVGDGKIFSGFRGGLEIGFKKTGGSGDDAVGVVPCHKLKLRGAFVSGHEYEDPQDEEADKEKFSHGVVDGSALMYDPCGAYAEQDRQDEKRDQDDPLVGFGFQRRGALQEQFFVYGDTVFCDHRFHLYQPPDFSLIEVSGSGPARESEGIPESDEVLIMVTQTGKSVQKERKLWLTFVGRFLYIRKR